MLRTPILITVRYSSSRLPGKCLIPIHGVPVLQHLLTRLNHAGFEVVICTSADPSDDEICRLAGSLGLPFFRGSLLNKIDRWAKCVDTLGVEYVHIIDADDPFVDTEEIAESITETMSSRLDLLKTSNRSDSGYASVGMTVSARFLGILSSRVEALNSKDLDIIPWDILIKPQDNVQQKRDKLLFMNSNLSLRLTLDYEEDLILITELITRLGAVVSRRDLEAYLESNPDLAMINAGNTELFLENKRIQLKRNFDLG